MSMRARKERIQDLYFRILDACSKRTRKILSHEQMKKIFVKFSLEHGLSKKTINEYVEILKTLEFLTNNVEEIYSKVEWGELELKFGESIEKYFVWNINEHKELPYWKTPK